MVDFRLEEWLKVYSYSKTISEEEIIQEQINWHKGQIDFIASELKDPTAKQFFSRLIEDMEWNTNEIIKLEEKLNVV